MTKISIAFTPESIRLLEKWDGVERRLIEELDRAFGKFITEAESSIINKELSGGLVNNRTGLLKKSIRGEVDAPLSGFVGTTQGSTTPYAKAILGPETTTIRPKNAKHLWVPVADNLNPSGIARYTPRGLFDTFGDRVKIFESKRGNTVVFVEDPKTESGKRAKYKKRVNQKDGRVSRKGDLKGDIYFVLKDEVVIEGTDALAKGVQRMLPRGQELIQQAISRAIPG